MDTAAVSLSLFYAVCCLASSATALSCSGNHSRLAAVGDSFNITFVCAEEIFQQCWEDEGLGSICSAHMSTDGVSESLACNNLEFLVSFNESSLREGRHSYLLDYCFQCDRYQPVIDCTCKDCPTASQGPKCYSRETILLMRVANFSLSVSNHTPSVGDSITFNCSSALNNSSDIPVNFTFQPHNGGELQNFTCGSQPVYHGGTQWVANRSHDLPHDCTLYGIRISADFSGTFQCVATLHNGESTESDYSTKLTIAVHDNAPVMMVGLFVPHDSEVALIAVLIVVVIALIVVAGVLLTLQWKLRLEEPAPPIPGGQDDHERRPLLQEEEKSSESSSRISSSTTSLSEQLEGRVSEQSTQFPMPLDPSQVTIEKPPTPDPRPIPAEEPSSHQPSPAIKDDTDHEPPSQTPNPPSTSPSAARTDVCAQEQQFKRKSSEDEYISQSSNKDTGKHCLKSNTPLGSATAGQSPNLLRTGVSSLTTSSPGSAIEQSPTEMASHSPGRATGMPSLESPGLATGLGSHSESPNLATGMNSLKSSPTPGPATGLGTQSESLNLATGMHSVKFSPSPGPATGLGTQSESLNLATGMHSVKFSPSPGPATGLGSHSESLNLATGMPSLKPPEPATLAAHGKSPNLATRMPSLDSTNSQSPGLATGLGSHSESPNLATGMHSLKSSPSPGLVTGLGTQSESLNLGNGMKPPEPSTLDAHSESPNSATGMSTPESTHAPGAATRQSPNLSTGKNSLESTPSLVLVDTCTHRESPDTDQDDCSLPRPRSQTGQASPKPSGSPEMKSHLRQRPDTGMPSLPGSLEQEPSLQGSGKGEATALPAETEPSQLEAAVTAHFESPDDTLSLSESGSDKTSLTESNTSQPDSLSDPTADEPANKHLQAIDIPRHVAEGRLNENNSSGLKWSVSTPSMY